MQVAHGDSVAARNLQECRSRATAQSLLTTGTSTAMSRLIRSNAISMFFANDSPLDQKMGAQEGLCKSMMANQPSMPDQGCNSVLGLARKKFRIKIFDQDQV